MPATIDTLDRVVDAASDRRALDGARSPIRSVTRQVAFEAGAWTPDRAAKVAALFNTMAPDWSGRHDGHHAEPLADALARGGPFPGRGRVGEVGSGTGLLTPLLAERFATVVAVEIAEGMARLAPADVGHRLLADGAALPCAAGAFDVVVLFNAFLFPAEVDRVLCADGVLVWVSAMGDDTPIYLPAADVGAALPGRWTGVAAEAGWGSWATFRRAGVPSAVDKRRPA